MHSSIAGMPSAVAGIFTITFGFATSFHSRCASAIVRAVSFAQRGATSMLTKPSPPPVRA